MPCHSDGVGNSPRLAQPLYRALAQIRVFGVLLEDAAHPLENVSVDLAEIAGPRYLGFAGHEMHENETACGVDLLNLPHAPGKGKAIALRRSFRDRADLIAAGADGVIFAVLEHRKELERRDERLSAQSHKKLALLGQFKIIVAQHREKQLLVVVLCHPCERGK